ncbi:hypothetical protein GQR93_15005 (plasmid) [Lentilactobacillus hilgardii]|jgi:hypothetical protein|uniref:Uncharacterized protein n=1 Tax=Lentilactobacillus hilgardii TaxID=1588 RepID=A0A6P1E895_LENHI|nr:hypothetical protein [Lentilactobacillus hilgardii]QHB53557.1 hypothetical protein GQR93_15005 [Lentilactobacillus hilgardii]
MSRQAESSKRMINRYQIYRQEKLIGTVMAFPDYVNQIFYLVFNEDDHSFRIKNEDIFIDFQGDKYYITNVERIHYSYHLKFETNSDHNRCQKPQSWINTLAIKTFSFKDIESLLSIVQLEDREQLVSLIAVLKRITIEHKSLKQHDLFQFKDLLDKYNVVEAKLAEFLLNHLVN